MTRIATEVLDKEYIFFITLTSNAKEQQTYKEAIKSGNKKGKQQ